MVIFHSYVSSPEGMDFSLEPFMAPFMAFPVARIQLIEAVIPIYVTGQMVEHCIEMGHVQTDLRIFMGIKTQRHSIL